MIPFQADLRKEFVILKLLKKTLYIIKNMKGMHDNPIPLGTAAGKTLTEISQILAFQFKRPKRFRKTLISLLAHLE